ncbi:MAG TPA: gamma-glutamyltransferase [Novosphingobium sp.]|nr:gamma-glutamyltransferase [Novosphingobium sp.]
MLARFLTPLAALALAACATLAPTAAPPTSHIGQLDSVPVGSRGLVSAADPRAAAAGAAMLRAGGSATDAAIATMLALTVVEPQSSGIGGGGFLVLGDDAGRVETLDGRETAPMAANGQWFFRDGKPLSVPQAIPGGLSVGVPGNLRLAAEAHERHGKLPWRTLFGPAIALAHEGFAITPRLYEVLDRFRGTGALDPEGKALFYDAAGAPLPVGTVVRNRNLALTLTELSTRGADSFYVGPNAQALSAGVRAAPVNPAPMAPGDLATYQAKWREPVCGVYRGYRICGMGPPSSGATTVLAILEQLERFDLRALGKDSPVAWHLIAESQRLAYADRERYLGDADFVPVPVSGLVDPAYLAQRGALIAPDRTLAAAAPGNPPGGPIMREGVTAPEHGTSHFVAVDAKGNTASYTSTVESIFGSGLVVGGYYLNNELTDFSLVPTRDGHPVANRVEPGKRPRSSMSPTLIYGPDGSLRAAIGAAGGATIIVQVAKAIVGMLDWGLSAQDAIALPTLFAPADTVYVEQGTALEALIPALKSLGHAKVEAREPSFKANAIERVGNRWVGAADPRSEGAAVAE